MTIKKLLRRLSRVADSSRYECIRDHAEQLPAPEARKGHVPVYVGDDMERFVVPVELLGHPALVGLLDQAAQEYGYRRSGALRIPCSVPVFERILSNLGETDG